MKSAYLIHGWSGSPNEPMWQWLKYELEALDVRVSAPNMPDSDHPKIEPWINTLNDLVSPDEDAILIGHSIGCQAVLRYLAQLPWKSKVAGIVLIAPWMQLDDQTIREEGPESIAIAKPWVTRPIDFDKVRLHTRCSYAIFSDNDPFVSLSQRELFERQLGARIVVEHHKGHFTREDGVAELPSALQAAKACLGLDR